MKAGKYSFKDLFVSRYIDQIIIPEIQRDYVWQEEQVRGLLNSLLNDFKDYQNYRIPDLGIGDDIALVEAFNVFHRKQTCTSNIGFIYAYCDEEMAGRYFLIDGQQRITTIFLLLLCLASRNDALKQQFRRTYMTDDGPKLDYRVRENAQVFLNNFCNHYLITGNQKPVKEKTWFFSFYEDDATIKNISSNFNLMVGQLKETRVDEVGFYSYLEEFIEFWYFDTNVSQQGEELYIYMNARGEHVQSNENIKADLLSRLESDSSKEKYGRAWEGWQDFFWQHKRENKNADQGFNEFLSCISGLQNYLGSKSGFYSKKDFDSLGEIRTMQILETLTIEDVGRYVEVLKFLEDKKARDVISKAFDYSKWIDKCLGEIWVIINSNKTNWHADYNDQNRGLERRRMVFLWSVFYYLEQRLRSQIEKQDSIIQPNRDTNKELEDEPRIYTETFVLESFRFLRMFYLRYKNNNRSAKALKSTVDFLLSNSIGILDYRNEPAIKDAPQREALLGMLNKEEIEKANFFNKYQNDQKLQRQFEELIWEIEDHKYNIDGSEVGGTNITHLVDFENIKNLQDLILIKEKFYELFPPSEENYPLLQNILLSFGEYWDIKSPYYYKNLVFHNWRRIIRGLEAVENRDGTKAVFKTCFSAFLSYDGSVEDWWEKIKEKATANPKGLREWLLWYAIRLDKEMWANGNYIAISKGSPCALPDWNSKDEHYKSEFILYNTKGNLKGGTPKCLSKKLIDA